MVSVIKIALQVAILLGDEQRTYIRVLSFKSDVSFWPTF
jgi:hypothetical protein